MIEADSSRKVYNLLGLPIDAVDLAAAVKKIQHAVRDRQRCFLTTPNLNFLIACQKDREFLDSVIASDLCVADGMPLVWMARLLGLPIRERVAGSSIFEALAADNSQPMSVFFFGGPSGAGEAACRRLNDSGGALSCVGFLSPGYGSIEGMSDEKTLAAINSANPDFVVVALGAKKGQAWIMRNRERLNAPVISHLGAVVNFIAGTVGRAPRWMQRCGLEWIWRIKEEPDLWRRYWGDGLALLKLLATQVIPRAMARERCYPPPDPKEPGISATVPDWRREAKAFWAWNPPRSLLASIRAYQRHANSRNPFCLLLKKLAVLRHRFWSVVTGADIPVNSRISGGLLIPHPNGIVIHPDVQIGPNCLIFQQVTIGHRKGGVPVIGGHVDIGAGAKVLGPIMIGNHARVGANAVVVTDIPSGATAIGIPAAVD